MSYQKNSILLKCQLIFDKSAKRGQWEDNFFNKLYQKNWRAICKQKITKLNHPYLSSYTAIKSKCIIYLNITGKVIETLEENMTKFSDIQLAKISKIIFKKEIIKRNTDNYTSLKLKYFGLQNTV